MNRISLHCSSFVGKQCGYQPPHSWEDCVRASAQYYAPLETFPERFGRLILHVQSLGYTAMDVWQPAQLNWQWATPEHITAAHRLLNQHHMAVTSLAGEFGQARDEFDLACRLAEGIGAPLLSGLTDLLAKDRAYVVATLQKYNLKLALENHPEKNAQEMLAEIGDGGEGCIGTAVDTGWYATNGFDVVQAIRELGDTILHVHLKNVLPGEEHINCGFGKGCVPLEFCVKTLKGMGYPGDYSIENHTLDHDPDNELREARQLVQEWLVG